jgi:hypothetical protein
VRWRVYDIALALRRGLAFQPGCESCLIKSTMTLPPPAQAGVGALEAVPAPEQVGGTTAISSQSAMARSTTGRKRSKLSHRIHCRCFQSQEAVIAPRFAGRG